MDIQNKNNSAKKQIALFKKTGMLPVNIPAMKKKKNTLYRYGRSGC